MTRQDIAIVAMRCAGLLQLLQLHDRVSGNVIESYSAAALACWSLPFKGYDGDRGAQVRSSLSHRFKTAAPYLDFGDFDNLRIASDHAFDALVSAVVARAAALALTAMPQASDVEIVRGEGSGRGGWAACPL